MLTLSTATSKIHACAEALAAADTPTRVIGACAIAKLTCRDIARYLDDNLAVVSLLDGDCADLGHAAALLHATLTDLRPGQSFHAAGFALDDALAPALRLVTRLQRICAASPCFEDA